MITAIAIDDEPPALKVIRLFSADCPGLSLENSFTSTTEAAAWLLTHPVDLLFLDIQMPAMTGLDFYKMSGADSLVIFTTAYSEYAVAGFALDAVDYLLKPFTADRFRQAVRKAEEYREFRKHRQTTTDFIFLKADAAILKVFTREILFVEAADDYLRIHLEQRLPLIVRLTMKALLEMLPGDAFLRVHRSFIVPFARVREVRNKSLQIAGKTIPIGSLYEEALFRRLGY